MEKKTVFYRLFRGLAAAITAVLLALPVTIALAHGSTTVGDYTIEIGFKNEPALQGELNGLDLLVRNTKTAKPVTGLENTLQAEVIFGSSKQKVKIEPLEGQDGEYTAPLLPTRVGDYTWHITGKIENTPVDISMTSSPTTFASVEPRSSVSFPGREPDTTVLENDLLRARQTAVIGLVVGMVGALLSIVSLGLVLTRTRRP
jgi:hypothetical protein